ncbi:hypothetical protein ACD578_07790 [Microvirga sp. RSM25]|uniref:hypothetical protein n=1 Tax=Microvirga sp. RSM25 TaxID=3273802 RepID=UPI003850F391
MANLEYINRHGVWLEGNVIPLGSNLNPKKMPPILTLESLDPLLGSVAGLFYETTQNGYPVWKISQGLRPGDPLHQTLLGHFTNEQHWELISASRVSNVLSHGDLMITVGSALCNYQHFQDLSLGHETFSQHRDRLADIAKYASLLRPLFEAEPLRFKWTMIESEASPVRGKNPFKDIDWFCAALQSIEKRAANLASNPEGLQEIRFDAIQPLSNTKKSERQYIWEPIFRFWIRTTQKVGYSEDGPIMRVLRIIHSTLGIAAPNADAVRQAIKDFNGRPRANRRLAAPKKQ